MHNIVNRPVCVGDQIVARPMMYLALTYDHRLIDGFLFLFQEERLLHS